MGATTARFVDGRRPRWGGVFVAVGLGLALAIGGAGCGGSHHGAGSTSAPRTASSNTAASTTTTHRGSEPPTSTTATTSAALGPRTFTVAPASVTVGRPVTFSGTACPATDVVLGEIAATSATAGTQIQVAPAADGSWSATVAVGDATMPGRIDAHATCVVSATHAPVFGYSPVTVTVGTPRHIAVEPAGAVPAGTTLALTPSAACPQQSPPGWVLALLQAPDASLFNTEPVVAGGQLLIDLGADGRWSGSLVVPALTPPGRYVLNTTCAGPSRSIDAWYVPVSITVVPRNT